MGTLMKSCRVDGCSRPRRPGRTLCSMHAHRLARYGDVGEPEQRIIRGDDEARFWTKVEKTDTCWLWRGAIWEGYGVFSYRGRRSGRAHRWAYEHLVGPIPDGLTLDHLCRVRHCVNPAHLEAVTAGENSLRGDGPAAMNAQRTECRKGHLFTEETTRYTSTGWRYCVICKRDNGRRRRAQNRERR